jgi:hypothetical protein
MPNFHAGAGNPLTYLLSLIGNWQKQGAQGEKQPTPRPHLPNVPAYPDIPSPLPFGGGFFSGCLWVALGERRCMSRSEQAA